jgi:hypothetical protein
MELFQTAAYEFVFILNQRGPWRPVRMESWFFGGAKDNLIGEETRRSRSDYNRPGMLHLNNWYTNSRGRRDLVEHDNPATRALVLQAIEELAKISRTSTELWDEYEVYYLKTQ